MESQRFAHAQTSSKRADGFSRPPPCLRAVSEHLVSACGLKADMQRDERIVKLIAHREQRLAPSDHARVLALRQQHLILGQLHHGPSGGKVVDRIEPVQPENLWDTRSILNQGVVIGINRI